MKRDPTKRVIESFQELMGAQHVSEVKDGVAQVNIDKDIGTMIVEIRQILLNGTEAAREVSPSHAMCLSWLSDNMHLLDANKLYVLKEVTSGCLRLKIRRSRCTLKHSPGDRPGLSVKARRLPRERKLDEAALVRLHPP
jgi:hypothetical protein